MLTEHNLVWSFCGVILVKHYSACFMSSFHGETDNRQRTLRKRNFVVMGFLIKALWQDYTYVPKCTLNALCLLFQQ